MKSYLAIIIGGSAGCLIRWLLGARLNSLFPDLPPGTLVVNLAGGFIIGASLAWFMRHPDLDPAWRLLVITGLCGGLTTFSTFSLEIFSQLQSGNYFWHCCKVSDEAAFCLIQRPYISKTLLTRRISPRGSP
ncbi:CrcB-like protein [Klebsiella pneumoniae]|nr:CrcB-like protein [Klebsiella pneumoniae]